MRFMTGRIELGEEIKSAIESVVDGWYSEGRIDWQDFLDRVEKYSDIDLGQDMDSPLIRAIKKYTREYRAL